MIGVSLAGVDGSQWDLRRGQIVLGPGVEGFGLPKFDRPTSESPARDGQQLQSIGSRALARSGILPMIMQEQVSDLAWLSLQRAWWAAWSPDLPCTLTVTDPAGGVRTLKVFLDGDDGYSLDDEPSIALFERLPTSWIADDPWYRGPVQSQRIDVPTGGDWLVGGTAPPFQFQAAATTGAGTLANPGEVPAWPVHTISAGATSFSITVNGQTTAGTITVPTGARLVIDTDPAAQTILLIASDGSVTAVPYSQLSSVGFAPIPVGGSVPVTTALTGANGASITVAIEPRYRRAF